ncbi:hypothetical protein ABBQ32_013430 [Trebouxia sp. C0010 RCD-2024]
MPPKSDVAELLDCHVGEHFVAIFGSNQSALETVLLKRRVMMPCWLSLKHPTRIDTSAQVHLTLNCACPDCSNCPWGFGFTPYVCWSHASMLLQSCSRAEACIGLTVCNFSSLSQTLVSALHRTKAWPA